MLVSLAKIILDPFYRTIQGFRILIENEWLAYGHRFQLRLGLGEVYEANNQRSPTLLQFFDCVQQIMVQYPEVSFY
jgi:hypothetical protein